MLRSILIVLLLASTPVMAGVDSFDTSATGTATKSLASAVEKTSSLQSWLDGKYLTGDWGGERKQLLDEGVTPYVYYNAIVAGNPWGGISQACPQYAQDMNFGLTFDMQKLVGWTGGTFNINGVDRIGNTIRPDIGNLYDPMQLVGGSTIYLYNITVEQEFWNNKGSFKFGRLSPGDDFASSPLYGYYLNNGIDGQVKAIVLDTRFATYPYPVWGGRLRFDPSPEWNSMTGLYQVYDRMFDSHLHGLNFSIDGGYSLVQQFAWTPEFDKRPVQDSGSRGNVTKEVSASQMRGMPGHYAFTGYWSNSNYSQFGTSATTRLSYGFLLQADQMVYREAPGSDLGLTLWATFAYAPQQNISLIPVEFSGGAVYQGLLPTRPQDQTIFGFIYGNFSSNYSNTIINIGGGNPTAETVLEWGYRINPTKFSYLQPDLQYFIKPYGTGNIPNAVVLGIQFGLTL